MGFLLFFESIKHNYAYPIGVNFGKKFSENYNLTQTQDDNDDSGRNAEERWINVYKLNKSRILLNGKFQLSLFII